MSENKPRKVRKYSQVELPNGFRPTGTAVRVAISFDDDQYDALRDYAFVHDVSFAEAVRRHLTLPETHTEA